MSFGFPATSAARTRKSGSGLSLPNGAMRSTACTLSRSLRVARQIATPLNFLRLGQGSIGGKARGLAFVRRLLSMYDLRTKFPNVEIQVPPTAVLGRFSSSETGSMTALWSVMGAIITPEPKSGCVPFMWHYDKVRSRLLEAGNLITAKEAERRVLILENLPLIFLGTSRSSSL